MHTDDADSRLSFSLSNSSFNEKNLKLWTFSNFVRLFSWDGTFKYSHDRIQKKIPIVRRSATANSKFVCPSYSFLITLSGIAF